MLIELLRRGYTVNYALTSEGWEVDFYAQAPGRETLLIQVSADVTDASTREREVRALVSAAKQYPDAVPQQRPIGCLMIHHDDFALHKWSSLLRQSAEMTIRLAEMLAAMLS